MRKRLVAAVLALALALAVPFPVQAVRSSGAGKEAALAAGKKRKARWVYKKKGTYYKKKNGKYAKGSYKIGGVYYVFSKKGKLLKPETNSHKKVGSTWYYVSPEGKALYGWHFLNGNFYYATSKGKLKKKCTVQGIALNSKGRAQPSDLLTWQMKITETVDEIVSDDMTKEEKLKACWRYLTSKENFRYRLRYPDLEAENWYQETAYDMFLTHSGNCYSFACAFAAMANQIGYYSYVVCGRVSGTRDRAADRLTRHCWVRINDGWYDPEAQFAGFYKNCYGSTSYGIRHEIGKIVKYVDGSVEYY